MLFNKISALVAFAALIAVSPIDITDDNGSVLPRAAKSVNDCGDSTFENHSSDGSPLVVDCQRIVANIANGGSWTVSTLDQHQLVQYGTCAFGVQADDQAEGPTEVDIGWMYIGNQDIIDLINDSINKFQWQGKVGAAGQMKCQVNGPGDDVPVNWGLYHT